MATLAYAMFPERHARKHDLVLVLINGQLVVETYTGQDYFAVIEVLEILEDD